jgi:hypothetical protein
MNIRNKISVSMTKTMSIMHPMLNVTDFSHYINFNCLFNLLGTFFRNAF